MIKRDMDLCLSVFHTEMKIDCIYGLCGLCKKQSSNLCCLMCKLKTRFRVSCLWIMCVGVSMEMKEKAVEEALEQLRCLAGWLKKEICLGRFEESIK